MVAIIYALPNFFEKPPAWLPGNSVNLGLDLRGGSHLLLDVEFDDYMSDISQSVAESLKKYLREKKIGYRNLSVTSNNVTLKLRSNDDFAAVKKVVRNIDNNKYRPTRRWGSNFLR